MDVWYQFVAYEQSWVGNDATLKDAKFGLNREREGDECSSKDWELSYQTSVFPQTLRMYNSK